jgi:AcrR family transcriptional regulator
MSIMTEPEEKDDRREAVLDAAFRMFVTYGFKRTTMGDIADAAGISRPALYLIFKNKNDIFRAKFLAMLGQVFAGVASAFDSPEPFVTRLVAAALAGTILPLKSIMDTPHGAELFDVKQEIAEDLGKLWFTRLEDALADGIEIAIRNGEIDLSRSGLDIKTLARLLVSAVEGVKLRMTDHAAAEADMATLIKLMITPLTSGGQQ